MIAEESTAWPMVTKPTYMGGLGFNYKWNMGWMNDMLRYMSLDPLFRKGSHNSLTFSFFYAFSENFILPISHDEVVYGKGSLYNKMAGHAEEKAAGVRCFATYMMAHPGQKNCSLWARSSRSTTSGTLTKNSSGICCNTLSTRWRRRSLKSSTRSTSVVPSCGRSISRGRASRGSRTTTTARASLRSAALTVRATELIAVCNFLPVRRENYCIGVPYAGVYEEVFTSDAAEFGGTGFTNGRNIRTVDEAMHGFEQSISLTLPENTVFFLRCKRKAAKKPAAKTTKTTAKKPAAKKPAAKKAAGTKAAKKKA